MTSVIRYKINDIYNVTFLGKILVLKLDFFHLVTRIYCIYKHAVLPGFVSQYYLQTFNNMSSYYHYI